MSSFIISVIPRQGDRQGIPLRLALHHLFTGPHPMDLEHLLLLRPCNRPTHRQSTQSSLQQDPSRHLLEKVEIFFPYHSERESPTTTSNTSFLSLLAR